VGIDTDSIVLCSHWVTTAMTLPLESQLLEFTVHTAMPHAECIGVVNTRSCRQQEERLPG